MDETPLSDSRCATHPSDPTVAICRRCGDHLCAECLAPDALGAVFCTTGALVPAPRGARLLGASIDGTLVAMGAAFGVIVATKLLGIPGSYGLVAGALGTFSLQIGLVARYQRSIGKLMMGTQIVKKDGSPAEPWRAAVLHTLLAKTLLSAIPLVNLADQLWIFAPGSRCLHDIASGTRVIAVRRAACPRPLG